MKKIAIIGFGGAGYSAAREIRRLDPRAVIDVYSDTDTGPYNPMLTTYYFTEIDEKGRVNVSHRDLMEKPEGWDEEQRAKRAARDRRDGEKRVFRKREQ